VIQDSWHGEGTSTTIPRLYYNNLQNFAFSNLHVQDASYLRLRNLSVGYTIPKKRGFESLRFSLSAQNVFTLTKYEGARPDQMGSVARFGVYNGAMPLAPTYVLGIRLTF
jgi:hypothetical protein